jgi:lysophospholipase L1-like esterase
MRRFQAWLFALALAAAAGCGERVPRLAALGPNDVIVAFGDSLTYGTGANADESYPAVLERLIGRRVVRSGVPGEVTAGGLARIATVLAEHQPALVIVCLGGNDMLRKVDEATIKSNLRQIIQTIRSRGSAVVLVGVPRPGLLTRSAEFYEELAREFGIPYEGRIVTSVLYRPDEKSDPIHPNAKGYRRIAQAIAELLKKAGAL